ncbi:MAG: hypothetical protein WAM98_03090 [Terriglobales bacterium]
MIRLFNVYYPIRTLVLLIGDALIVWTSFLLGVVYAIGSDSYLVLYVEDGYYKIFGLTILVLLCSHGLDLYDTTRLNTKGELYFRLLMLPGVMAFILAGVAWVRPNYLLGGRVFDRRAPHPDGRSDRMAASLYPAGPVANSGGACLCPRYRRARATPGAGPAPES